MNGFESRHPHYWLAQWKSTEPRTRASQVQLLRQPALVVCRLVSGAAVVTYKVADPLKAVTTVEDYRQALYREAQLALRGVIRHA